MDEFERGTATDDHSSTCDLEFLNGRLEELKRDGCNILVTGSVSPSVTFHATRNLFGDDRCDRRRQRIVACTDLHPPGNHYLLTGYDEPPTVVSSAGLERSLATVENGGTEPLPTTPTEWVETFTQEVCATIGDADATVDGLESAQLRLSVMTLRPIVESVSYRRADRSLRLVTNLVNGVAGMAHYHLPTDRDAEITTRHADLFDLEVELRKRDGLPAESRWHFPDDGKSTTWYTL